MHADSPSSDRIDARTRLVTLLGYPLSHSLSPIIHNAAFRAQGVPMVYLCMPVPPDDLADALTGLQALRFVGSNVTIPHKQAMYGRVDTLSDRARAVGAVNTVVCRPGSDGARPSLHGDNTDIVGFLAPLAPYFDRLRGESMLVFGAGGSARAVVYALLSALEPARLWIAARNTARAEALATAFAGYDRRGGLSVCAMDDAPAVRASRLLVNTTPLGMQPNTEATPWPAGGFSPEQIGYDLVYNPRETRFLADVAASGALAIGGLDMLIEQAAASYVQWTGVEMPREVVRQALALHLPA
ncbi:MAG: shikimate dehydrogenase [Rhodothermales bacterium]